MINKSWLILHCILPSLVGGVVGSIVGHLIFKLLNEWKSFLKKGEDSDFY